MRDIHSVREDFPILHQEVNGKPLVYFDNAATSQKPQVVIDAVASYYQGINSNVHRGVHKLSQLATDAFEQTRNKVKNLLNAQHAYEVIFTSGTTAGINLVASSYGQKFVSPGDEILISHMEHHSNIVPWQLLCERQGAHLKVIPITDSGELDMEAFYELLSEKTKLISLVFISNALGTINPVKEIIQAAHSKEIPVLLDAAQAIPHQAVDVQELDCDFLVFSGHKILAPTGTGILYGKEKWLNEMPPFLGGGDMIDVVRFEKTTYAGLPHKFEAGTPDIAGVVGMGTAIDYIQEIGYGFIDQQEKLLLEYGTRKLEELGYIQIIGTSQQKTSVISFLIEGIHPYDAGTILDHMGVAIRTGHHCTQPIMERFSIPGTMRASFAFYNTLEEIDRLIEAIKQAKLMLG
ncbi:MAG: cysteine desulfurase [Bacteroidota bacterium]